MAEGAAAFVEGIVALMEMVFHVLVRVVLGAFTLVAYLCSRAYRGRREAEWTGRSFRKFLELGYSGLCLAGLISLTAWLWFEIRSRGETRTARPAETKFNLQVMVQHGTNGYTLDPRDGGAEKIVTAQDLNDLVNRVKEKVKVVEVRTNLATNHSVKFQFSISGRK